MKLKPTFHRSNIFSIIVILLCFRPFKMASSLKPVLTLPICSSRANNSHKTCYRHQVSYLYDDHEYQSFQKHGWIKNGNILQLQTVNALHEIEDILKLRLLLKAHDEKQKQLTKSRCCKVFQPRPHKQSVSFFQAQLPQSAMS